MKFALRRAAVLPLFLVSLFPASHAASGNYPAKEVEPGVIQVGLIQIPAVKESSGIVASRKHPGVFWTHNDGGGSKRQILYAIDRQGKQMAMYLVRGTPMDDWEDIALDSVGQLYLGDIGNNEAQRKSLFVHRVTEPDLKQTSGTVQPIQTWELTFPGKPFDCEALVVHGTNGYVISKVFDDKNAEIYRFALAATTRPVVLAPVARLPITSPVTGADLSADNASLGVVSRWGAYWFKIDGDMAKAGTVEPTRLKFKDRKIEGCSFVLDGLLATAESREIFLFKKEAFRASKEK